MIRVALVEPEIPPNTGNIARLCAATNVPLHIVGVTGFRLDDRAVRRAGLDYWPEVILAPPSQISTPSTASLARGPLSLSHHQSRQESTLIGTLQRDDCLVFGRETRGLPEDLLRANWDSCLTIPMLNPNVRSLNLATAVGIVLYEALRQTRRFQNANHRATSELSPVFVADVIECCCGSYSASKC